jgi:hypothetical protein
VRRSYDGRSTRRFQGSPYGVNRDRLGRGGEAGRRPFKVRMKKRGKRELVRGRGLGGELGPELRKT